MIQRLQSLYLLLGGAAFLGTLLFRSALVLDTLPWIMPVAVVLNVLVSAAAIGLIFLYGDRNRQRKLVDWLQYLALLAIVAVFGGLYMSGRVMEASEDAGVLAMLVLPVLGYVLIRLAGNRIQKDIELVRSMDRLR